MGGCQNSDPFLGTLNTRGRIVIGTQKGTTILTTTHIGIMEKKVETTLVYWGLIELRVHGFGFRPLGI